MWKTVGGHDSHPGSTVLSIGASAETRGALKTIVGNCAWVSSVKWNLRLAPSVESAIQVLGGEKVQIVLCETDRNPNFWKRALALVERVSQPPFLIVASRVADERLWAEALNLGAYDVLPLPFENREVTRTLSFAWLKWEEKYGPGRRTARSERLDHPTFASRFFGVV